MKRTLPLILLLATTSQALARPVSYAGGSMIMTGVDGESSYIEYSYSPTARDAFGIQIEHERRNRESTATFLTYNRLVNRWNMPSAQANLFLTTGIGAAENGDDTNAAAFAGIMTDYETRRIYFGYEGKITSAPSIETSAKQRFRAGFAPYEGDAGDLHTWLFLQADHRPEREGNEWLIGPVIRMFKGPALWELGINQEKELFATFTLTF